MHRLPLLIVGLVFCGALMPANAKLEDGLRKEYVGSERMLRQFCAADVLKFDVGGNPLNQEKTAPWTLAGAVKIDRLELKSDKLVLHGHRQLVAVDEANHQFRYLKSDAKFSLEVLTQPGPDQQEKLLAALARVFLSPQEDLSPSLPDYWHDYMAHWTGQKVQGQPCEDSHVPTDEGVKPKVAVKIPTEVVDGLKINSVTPVYLSAARAHRIEGDASCAQSSAKMAM